MTPDAHMILALLDYQKHILASYEAIGGDSGGFQVQFHKGSKYIRVVTMYHQGSQSCHSFIDERGFIWKSASWKAPAKNFPRGDVKDPSTWTNIRWNGI